MAAILISTNCGRRHIPGQRSKPLTAFFPSRSPPKRSDRRPAMHSAEQAAATERCVAMKAVPI